MKPLLKKILKIVATFVATAFTLIVLLATLLYVPPVQKWVVSKVAAYASETTGMSISIDRVRLSFPLDLSIGDLLATQPNDSLHNSTDTIAAAKELIAGVRLIPLLSGDVEVKTLDFRNVKMNTAHFVPSARIKGCVGRLKVNPSKVGLSAEMVNLGPVVLSDANVDVALSDTVPEDTTQSENMWRIAFSKLSVKRSDVVVHMPGDTLQIGAHLGDVSATNGDIDLGKGVYNIGSLDWRDGALSYDDNFAPRQKGLDFGHIALTNLSLRIDSLNFINEGSKLSLALNRLAFRERSGLSISSMTGHVRLDTAHISLPDLRLNTPVSHLKATAEMDFSTFADTNPGVMSLNADASIGKSDIMRFLGFMPLQFILRWPEAPLAINADIKGNMRNAVIRKLSAKLPSSFSLNADGRVANLLDMSRLKAHVNLDARADNISFLLPLAGIDAKSPVRVPSGITLKGSADADGPRYATEFTAQQGGGTLRARANINTRSLAYHANLTASALPLGNFLPGYGLHPFSGELSANGSGFDFLSPRTNMKAVASVRNFRYGAYDLSNINLHADIANGTGQAVLDSHNPVLNGIIDLRTLLSKRRVEASLMCNLLNADFQKLGITPKPLATSLTANVRVKSDLRSTHSAQGVIGNIVVRDSARTYRPENVLLDVFTRRDSTHANIACGDFALRLDGSGGVEHILNRLTAVSNEATKQSKERYIDQLRIRERLPLLSLYLDTGRELSLIHI